MVGSAKGKRAWLILDSANGAQHAIPFGQPGDDDQAVGEAALIASEH